MAGCSGGSQGDSAAGRTRVEQIAAHTRRQRRGPQATAADPQGGVESRTQRSVRRRSRQRAQPEMLTVAIRGTLAGKMRGPAETTGMCLAKLAGDMMLVYGRKVLDEPEPETSLAQCRESAGAWPSRGFGAYGRHIDPPPPLGRIAETPHWRTGPDVGWQDFHRLAQKGPCHWASWSGARLADPAELPCPPCCLGERQCHRCWEVDQDRCQALADSRATARLGEEAGLVRLRHLTLTASSAASRTGSASL
jgi:hypothetical protein